MMMMAPGCVVLQRIGLFSPFSVKLQNNIELFSGCIGVYGWPIVNLTFEQMTKKIFEVSIIHHHYRIKDVYQHFLTVILVMWGLTAPETVVKVKTIRTETLMKLAVDCRVKFRNDTLSCRGESTGRRVPILESAVLDFLLWFSQESFG